MNKRVAITTLGCKSNQCDSFFIQEQIKRNGMEIVDAPSVADVCIINTCTVTARSDYQCRQAIRRIIRENSSAEVYITGCYAVTGREEIQGIPGVTKVIPPEDIDNFLDGVVRRKNSKMISGNNGFHFVEDFIGRTRAFFKIQDGCNFRCSFCIVPFARGKSRSLPVNDVLHGFKRYAQLGYKEVVLTGVHLGSYGADLYPSFRLDDLLAEIAEKISGIRIRISSLDPNEISDRTIRLVSETDLFCRHFHIPLQSGDKEVLRNMNRGYTPEKFSEVVMAIKKRIPDAGIGIDVIAGFPGEGEKEFRNTCSLIHDLPITYLHAFPFSLRKGTRAWAMNGNLTRNVIKDRVRSLISIGKAKRMEFFNFLIGRELDVIVEGENIKGMWRGFSSSYVPVLIENCADLENRLVRVRIERASDSSLVAGEVLNYV